MRSRQIFFLLAVGIFVLGLLGGLFYTNFQIADKASVGHDFRLYWSGARYFLFQGMNPYQAELAAQIRREVYGIPLNVRGNLRRLEYPFHILLLYLPFSLFPNVGIALALWLVLLQVSLIALLWMSLRLLEWRPSPLHLFVLLVFVLFWQYGLEATLDGNASILLAVIFVGALIALQREADEVSGILLAFTTFKWEAGGLLFLLLLLWVLSKRRWRVLSVFIITLAILVLLTTILVPSWFWPLQQSAFANLRAGKGFSTFRLFQMWWPGLGEKLAWGLALGLGIVLLLEWRAALGGDFRHLTWTAALTMTLPPLLGWPIETVNLVLLTFPVLVVLAVCDMRWQNVFRWLLPFLAPLLTVWPWAALFMTSSLKQTTYRLALLFPIGLVVALYWVKWWAVRPPRVWLDELKRGTQN